MLAAMFSGKFSLVTDAEGCHFIDRDGALFHHILTFLRSGKITKVKWGEILKIIAMTVFSSRI